MESRRNLRVHCDQHVLLRRDGRIPLFDPFANPSPERVAYDGRADVDNPLLRRLPQLLVVRQELDDRLVLEELVENVGELQVLVGGHVRMDNTVHRNELLLALDEVLHEVDGQRVHRRKIGLDVDGQEGKQLYTGARQHHRALTSLAAELRCKGCGRDGLVAVVWGLSTFHVGLYV